VLASLLKGVREGYLQDLLQLKRGLTIAALLTPEAVLKGLIKGLYNKI
jgi:hypothetical protein